MSPPEFLVPMRLIYDGEVLVEAEDEDEAGAMAAIGDWKEADTIHAQCVSWTVRGKAVPNPND